MDHETNRLSRLVALLTLLQTKRTLTANELAHRFSVSTRTIYRDIRTLEVAGVPIVTQEGKGFSIMDGYRLPPVMFTREEAIALLTAEKMASRLTDAPTAQLSGQAMDKLRAALRRADRDYLETLSPHIEVIGLGPGGPPDHANAYQQLVTAIAMQRVVRLYYSAADADEPTWREIEPIGLYLSQQWHLVAYCRLRQESRNFRLDRIQQLTLTEEVFTARPETLSQYRAAQVDHQSRQKVVLHFRPTTVPAESAQRLQDGKYQYGWAHDQVLANGQLEMIFFVYSLPYMAAWLLPYAGAISVVEPPALRQQLGELAQQVYHYFYLQNKV